QQRRRAQMALVLVAIDRQAARPHASLDLILEAGPAAISKHGVGAGAQGEYLADHVDSFAQAVGRSERTVITPAVLHDLASHGDAGPGMAGDLGAQVGFVVFEADVVAGPVLLDEIVLEN